jgi:two-component system, chemotaxis family, protein-glutamate methylesterase/glutaminase
MNCDIIVIGTSLGGLTALGTLLKDFPADYALPIAVVQHRSVESKSLLRELRRQTTLRVEEPSDLEPIAPGHLYIAPADYHLLIESRKFRLSTEGPVHYARPSIDVLFESAADAYDSRTVGVILTGANGDGARGSASIKKAGGVVVVQDPEDAECPVMPRATLNATTVDYVLPLQKIRSYLVGLPADRSK